VAPAATYLELSPATVTVNGHRCTEADPAWTGLDLPRAILRDENTLEMALFGTGASPDHHLDVPWCHPLDQPHGWRDGIRYRVRPRKPGWRFEMRSGRWLLIPA
jgi:hypothetical protein